MKFKSISVLVPTLSNDRQARSQDLEKGGLFWKSEKSANDLDPYFDCSWISFTRFVRKFRQNFSESSEIRRFFPPKIRWSPKKKRSSPKLSLIFWPKSEIQRFFPPKIRWSPKKKKKVFAEIESDFSAKFGNSNVSGGLFSIFHKKSASKALKTCDFAYFTSQWGARAPPPPPLATLLMIDEWSNVRLALKDSPDSKTCEYLLVVASLGSNLSCNHFFWRSEVDCHAMSSIFQNILK